MVDPLLNKQGLTHGRFADSCAAFVWFTNLATVSGFLSRIWFKDTIYIHNAPFEPLVSIDSLVQIGIVTIIMVKPLSNNNAFKNSIRIIFQLMRGSISTIANKVTNFHLKDISTNSGLRFTLQYVNALLFKVMFMQLGRFVPRANFNDVKPYIV